MGRPPKRHVDYFLHGVKASQALYILEKQNGNAGYVFYWKLRELIARMDNHLYDARTAPQRLQLFAECGGVSEKLGQRMMSTLVELGEVDAELWAAGYVWLNTFAKELAKQYSESKRVAEIEKPTLEELMRDNDTENERVSAHVAKS